MKTFTKTLACAVLMGAASFGAKAQTMMTDTMSMPKRGMDFKVGIGLNGGVLKDSSPYSYVLGADLQLQWDLMKNVAVTASGGYTRYMEKDNSGRPSFGYIPAMGGVKVYPGIGRMYLAGNIGAAFAIEENAETGLIYSGGTGYDWDNGLTIGVRYESLKQQSGTSTYMTSRESGFWGLRLGYNFL